MIEPPNRPQSPPLDPAPKTTTKTGQTHLEDASENLAQRIQNELLHILSSDISKLNKDEIRTGSIVQHSVICFHQVRAIEVYDPVWDRINNGNSVQIEFIDSKDQSHNYYFMLGENNLPIRLRPPEMKFSEGWDSDIKVRTILFQNFSFLSGSGGRRSSPVPRLTNRQKLLLNLPLLCSGHGGNIYASTALTILEESLKKKSGIEPFTLGQVNCIEVLSARVPGSKFDNAVFLLKMRFTLVTGEKRGQTFFINRAMHICGIYPKKHKRRKHGLSQLSRSLPASPEKLKLETRTPSPRLHSRRHNKAPGRPLMFGEPSKVESEAAPVKILAPIPCRPGKAARSSLTLKKNGLYHSPSCNTDLHLLVKEPDDDNALGSSEVEIAGLLFQNGGLLANDNEQVPPKLTLGDELVAIASSSPGTGSE